MISGKAKKLPPFHVMEVLERAQELESLGKNIIHLEIGEPDFQTAPHICQAASSALWSGETKYTHSLGLLTLREAIASYYNEKFKLELSPQQIIVTSGTSPALLLVFMSLLARKDEVIMSNPYYACYPNFVEYLDGKPVFVHTRESCGFRMEPEDVAAAITFKNKSHIDKFPMQSHRPCDVTWKFEEHFRNCRENPCHFR